MASYVIYACPLLHLGKFLYRRSHYYRHDPFITCPQQHTCYVYTQLKGATRNSTFPVLRRTLDSVCGPFLNAAHNIYESVVSSIPSNKSYKICDKIKYPRKTKTSSIQRVFGIRKKIYNVCGSFTIGRFKLLSCTP